MARTKAHERDRTRCKRAAKLVLKKSEAIRFITHHAKMATIRWQIDRRRLRRVLGLAKSHRDWRNDWRLDTERFCGYWVDARRWAAAWKAAAKEWRASGLNFQKTLVEWQAKQREMEADRDRLCSRVTFLEQEQRSIASKMMHHANNIIAEKNTLQIARDELRGRFNEAIALCAIAAEQRDKLQAAYDNLGDTYEIIQEKYDDLSCERDELLRRLEELRKPASAVLVKLGATGHLPGKDVGFEFQDAFTELAAALREEEGND